MQPQIKKPPSDEEEDLESLRLAALQSLKRPAPNPTVNTLSLSNNNNNIKPYKKPHKRGRGCHSNARNNRNGIFGSRIRSSTLISVPTIETEPFETNSTKKPAESSSKLILPQDRYTKQTAVEEKSESCSKFDRYKDSESESESDAEEVAIKLERSSSLEALMQELEKEIQRDTKPAEVPKARPTKKVANVKEERKPVVDAKPVPQPVVQKPQVTSVPVSTSTTTYSNTQGAFDHNQFVNFNPPAVQFDPHLTYNFPIANSVEPVKPKYYERPLSPLPFDTGVFNTITAPLSPRSAAFVLQNREIIERRKKSPRRSYSRSPSPRYRRSKSRSPSPIRQRTSPGTCNTARKSQTYKRSPPSRYNSPKRRRRSPANRGSFRSPYREVEPKERVQSRGVSLSLSPSPDRFPSPDLTEDKTVDNSVLEARRKKFESDAIPTEGIIRLKPKAERNEQLAEDEQSVEDHDSSQALHASPKSTKDELQPIDDNYIDLNLKVDDLFSDEDSDSENEGRFKSKSNDSSTNVQSESTKSKQGLRCKQSNKYESDSKCTKKERKEQDGVISSKVANSRHKSHLSPLENRKIEIKIRNPGKYEADSESEGRSKDKKTHSRKVEVTNQPLQSDSEENEVDVGNEGSGDLRAQLSRKRAKRQHMVPKIENIPSRLLQNALQSAVFKKLKKTKSKKKEKDLPALDGKVPIRLRLGIPGGADNKESKMQTKSFGKRSKNRAKYEQV